MNTARAIEQRITRDLKYRQWRSFPAGRSRPVEVLITMLAVTASMLVLGSYAQELLWALLAASGVLVLGTRSG